MGNCSPQIEQRIQVLRNVRTYKQTHPQVQQEILDTFSLFETPQVQYPPPLSSFNDFAKQILSESNKQEQMNENIVQFQQPPKKRDRTRNGANDSPDSLNIPVKSRAYSIDIELLNEMIPSISSQQMTAVQNVNTEQQISSLTSPLSTHERHNSVQQQIVLQIDVRTDFCSNSASEESFDNSVVRQVVRNEISQNQKLIEQQLNRTANKILTEQAQYDRTSMLNNSGLLESRSVKYTNIAKSNSANFVKQRLSKNNSNNSIDAQKDNMQLQLSGSLQSPSSEDSLFDNYANIEQPEYNTENMIQSSNGLQLQKSQNKQPDFELFSTPLIVQLQWLKNKPNE